VTAFLNVLRIIYGRLQESPAQWALTGSLGMALQGMPIEPHDIDVQTDSEGAYEIERRLARWMVRPITFSEAERIRSHFGEARIYGTKVEIMGDIQKRLPNGSWEDPVAVTRYRRIVDVDGMAIPVLSLEYEYEAYTRLERHDRAGQIRRFISEKQGGR